MRLRHLSLASVAIIAALFVISEFFTNMQLWGLTTLATLLIGAMVWQREAIVTRYGYVTGISAYVLATSTAYGVLLYIENDVLRWIVAIGLGVELLETLVCDTLAFLRRKRRLRTEE